MYSVINNSDIGVVNAIIVFLSNCAVIVGVIIALLDFLDKRRQRNFKGENDLHLGKIFLAKGRRNAVEFLESALTSFVETKEPFWQAGALLALGEYYLKIGDLDKAEHNLMSALRLYQMKKRWNKRISWNSLTFLFKCPFSPAKWLFGQAQTFLLFAMLECEKTNRKQANVYTQKALNILNSLCENEDEVKLGKADYYRICASIEHNWNKKGAIQNCDDAMKILAGIRTDAGENLPSSVEHLIYLQARNSKAYILQIRGASLGKDIRHDGEQGSDDKTDYDRSDTLLKRALVRFKKIDNIHGEAWTLLNLGDISQPEEGADRDIPETIRAEENALMYYVRALRLFRRSGNTIGTATVLWKLGEQCLHDRRLERAEKHLRQSLKYSRSLGNVMQEMCALKVYGDVRKEMAKDKFGESKRNHLWKCDEVSWEVREAKRAYIDLGFLANLVNDKDGKIQAFWRFGEIEELLGDQYRIISFKSNSEDGREVNYKRIAMDCYENAIRLYKKLSEFYDKNEDNNDVMIKIKEALKRIYESLINLYSDDDEYSEKREKAKKDLEDVKAMLAKLRGA